MRLWNEISGLLAVILLVVPFSTMGQESQKKIKRISIRDVYVQTGGISGRSLPGTVDDFRSLAPESVLLSNDLSGYSASAPNRGEYRTADPAVITNGMFSAALGIQFSDKEKTGYKANPQLRIGFNYFSGTNLRCTLYKEEHNPYDTLLSAQTGDEVYLDSMYVKEYAMEYRSDQIRLDASLLYRTNPAARVSLFTGIGITAGTSINALTQVHYNQSGEVQATDANGNSVYEYYSADGNYSTTYDQVERFINHTNYGVSAYMPMGIDFRCGKRREFWQRTHLFFELRPGINGLSIPELPERVNACMQYGFGLKIACD
jgi:hypothetical protein